MLLYYFAIDYKVMVFQGTCQGHLKVRVSQGQPEPSMACLNGNAQSENVSAPKFSGSVNFALVASRCIKYE